jgi:hypothetical protein
MHRHFYYCCCYYHYDYYNCYCCSCSSQHFTALGCWERSPNDQGCTPRPPGPLVLWCRCSGALAPIHRHCMDSALLLDYGSRRKTAVSCRLSANDCSGGRELSAHANLNLQRQKIAAESQALMPQTQLPVVLQLEFPIATAWLR